MDKLIGKRVLVTGGAGFIGSELVRQLTSHGAKVTVVDNMVNGKRENLDDPMLRDLQLVEADIRNVDLMKPLFAKQDMVFHLACLGVRNSIHNPFENHDVNATATLHLLELARQNGVQKFVYTSTSEVYGTAHWVPMTEEHPTMPMTVYGGGKLAGEAYTRAYYRTYGYPTLVIRPFNAYGPRSHHEGDSGEVIPKFMLRALAGQPLVIFGDGEQTRDFTFVSDTARGIILAALEDSLVGETVNIGSGYEITVNELAQTVLKLVGNTTSQIQYGGDRPGDVLRLFANIDKAKAAFGFAPEYSLAAGLEKLLAWYKAKDVSVEELLRQERVQTWVPDDAVGSDKA